VQTLPGTIEPGRFMFEERVGQPGPEAEKRRQPDKIRRLPGICKK
jgi:hypothetical protein